MNCTISALIWLDLLGSAGEGAMKVQFIYIYYIDRICSDLLGSAWICVDLQWKLQRKSLHVYMYTT